MTRAFAKLSALPKFEPRWFIWTITLLIVIGVSLSGYIIITSEKDSVQAYEGTLPVRPGK